MSECAALLARLSEYLDSELDPAVCAELEGHLAECPPCQDFLEALRRAVAHVASAEAPSLPRDLQTEIVAAYERARRTR